MKRITLLDLLLLMLRLAGIASLIAAIINCVRYYYAIVDDQIVPWIILDFAFFIAFVVLSKLLSFQRRQKVLEDHDQIRVYLVEQSNQSAILNLALSKLSDIQFYEVWVSAHKGGYLQRIKEDDATKLDINIGDAYLINELGKASSEG